MTQWVLASNNAGKLREFAQLFAQAQIDLIPQGQLDISEAPEPYNSFIENALVKARHASRCSGLPALADDSGLTVRALGGAPGVLSARYAQLENGEKSDAANNLKLLEALAGVEDRSASFVCVLVFVRHAEDPNPLVAQGAWHGEIATQVSGEGGFGYDPLFYLPQLGLSAAQLPAILKNTVSHRGQAMVKLMDNLRDHKLV
jgi:XTP/dITP diphosphohydrolase